MSMWSVHLHVEVPPVRRRNLSSKEMGEKSENVRARVLKAREIQRNRFAGKKGIYANADIQSREIREFCRVNDAGEELLKMAITKLGLSAKA